MRGAVGGGPERGWLRDLDPRAFDRGYRAAPFGDLVIDTGVMAVAPALLEEGLAASAERAAAGRLAAAEAEALAPSGRVPGMAAPGVPNAEVLDFVGRNRAAVERAVTQRMRQVGVEEEIIGMRGVGGVEEGAFTRYPGPQVGGNMRPDHPNVVSGRWGAGMNVDEAIFDPTFRAFKGPGRAVRRLA